MAQGVDGVKAEIIANGPVIAQIQPHTDFLTYSDGIYLRTSDAFKFQGSIVVKVLGWEYIKGSDVWLVEPFLGNDWGQNGVGKIAVGDTLIDQFALGFAAIPFTERMQDIVKEMQARGGFQPPEEGLGED